MTDDIRSSIRLRVESLAADAGGLVVCAGRDGHCHSSYFAGSGSVEEIERTVTALIVCARSILVDAMNHLGADTQSVLSDVDAAVARAGFVPPAASRIVSMGDQCPQG